MQKRIRAIKIYIISKLRLFSQNSEILTLILRKKVRFSFCPVALILFHSLRTTAYSHCLCDSVPYDEQKSDIPSLLPGMFPFPLCLSFLP